MGFCESEGPFLRGRAQQRSHVRGWERVALFKAVQLPAIFEVHLRQIGCRISLGGPCPNSSCASLVHINTALQMRLWGGAGSNQIRAG